VVQRGVASGHLLDVLLGLFTQCFLFRRPLLSVFEASYLVAPKHDHAVFVLPGAVVNELALACVLLFCAASDLRSPCLPHFWALDASPTGGAFVRSPLRAHQASELWRRGEKRGGYTMLQGRASSLLRELGVDEEMAPSAPEP